MAYLGLKMITYPARKTQIALLTTQKIIISTEYLDYTNVFIEKLAVELFRNFDINKHFINLESNK